MFNYCLILNAAPYFVLAQNETDLEETMAVYKEKIVTVIHAKELKVMEFKMQLSLFSKDTLLIPSVVQEDHEHLNKMLSSAEQEELISDLVTDKID